MQYHFDNILLWGDLLSVSAYRIVSGLFRLLFVQHNIKLAPTVSFIIFKNPVVSFCGKLHGSIFKIFQLPAIAVISWYFLYHCPNQILLFFSNILIKIILFNKKDLEILFYTH